MRSGLTKVLWAIDRIGDVFGVIAAGCLAVLIASMTYEVIARYVFSSPTQWAFDVSTMAYGLLYIAAAGVALRKKQHIMIDFIYVRLPPTVGHACHFLLYLLIVLPALVLLSVAGLNQTIQAHVGQETTKITPLALTLWPYYAALAASIIVLLLQVIAETLRHALELVRLLNERVPISVVAVEEHV
jgi:TRAP-type mannitol/chloroaromatic compound transport system permease small subunit